LEAISAPMVIPTPKLIKAVAATAPELGAT
jgi:hypothetical protein